MATQHRNHAAGDARNELDLSSPQSLLSRSHVRSRSTEKTDDVIISLSNAYENRRARQVGEWEQLYGQNVYRAN